MLFLKVKEYAQSLVDKNYSQEDIEKLVKLFIGNEKVYKEVEGQDEITDLDLQLEEKDIEAETEKQIKIEVAKAVKNENKKLIKEEMPRVEFSYGQHNGKGVFKSEDEAYRAGMWVKGFIYGNKKAQSEWENIHGKTVYAMQESTDSSGHATVVNYVVPSEVAVGINTLSQKYGICEAYATKYNTAGLTLYIPKLTTDVANVAWEDESAALDQGDVKVDRSTLTMEKLAVYAKLSNELIQDSPIDMANYFVERAAVQIAKAEDTAMFTGTGSPITGLDTNVSTNVVDSGSTAFTLAKFIAVVGTLGDTGNDSNYAWYVNRTQYFTAMASLLAAGGGNTIQSLGGDLGASFLGYPVRFCQTLSTSPSSAETLGFFGDLSATVAMGVKPGGIEVSVNPYIYWANDQTGVRVVKRVGICTDVAESAMVKLTI